MKIKYVFLVFTAVLILTGCASEAEKKEKRKIQIIESIQRDKGTVLFDDKNSLYYSTGDGLFTVNYDTSQSQPVQFYTNLDSLIIREYTMCMTPTTVEIKTITQNYKDYEDNQISKADIVNLFNTNKRDLFKIEYPWIIIGRDFIANLSEPYNIIKVSNLRDRGFGFKTDSTISSIKPKKIGGISLDKKLNLTDSLYHSDVIISLYKDSLKIQDMPGYLQYKTTMIPQEAWDGTWVYKEIIPEYKEFNLGSNEEIINELSYKYKDYGVPTWSIKLNEDNSETTDNRILWGDLDYSINSWNKNDLSLLYTQREKNIKKGIETIKSKAVSKVKKAREERNKKLEEQSKRELEKIKKDAIDISTVIDTYHHNTFKGEQLFPINRYYYLKTNLFNIQSGGDLWKDEWRFGMSGDGSYPYGSWIYSDDRNFLDLEYPTKSQVIIKAKFGGKERGHFIFYNAELVLW